VTGQIKASVVNDGFARLLDALGVEGQTVPYVFHPGTLINNDLVAANFQTVALAIKCNIPHPDGARKWDQ
jgi:hypothetical protein